MRIKEILIPSPTLELALEGDAGVVTDFEELLEFWNV